MESSRIDKNALARITTKNLVTSGWITKDHGRRFLAWCERQSMNAVLQWATEEDIQETIRHHNELHMVK